MKKSKDKEVKERADLFREQAYAAACELADKQIGDMGKLLHELFGQTPKLEYEMRELLKQLVRTSFAAGFTFYGRGMVEVVKDISPNVYEMLKQKPKKK